MSITIEYLWKDRKRHLGMPLSFTRYQLSEDRLFLSQGFLNIRDDDILLYRVRDIDTRRNLWQRLFGVGTITVLRQDHADAGAEKREGPALCQGTDPQAGGGNEAEAPGSLR